MGGPELEEGSRFGFGAKDLISFRSSRARGSKVGWEGSDTCGVEGESVGGADGGGGGEGVGGGGGADEGGGGGGGAGEEVADGVSLVLKSLSKASLSLLSSNSLCLARRTSFISLVAFRSVSVCFSLVLTRPSSILVCSC